LLSFPFLRERKEGFLPLLHEKDGDGPNGIEVGDGVDLSPPPPLPLPVSLLFLLRILGEPPPKVGVEGHALRISCILSTLFFFT